MTDGYYDMALLQVLYRARYDNIFNYMYNNQIKGSYT